MLQHIDFERIRPLGGDRREAFEEFVCQLARHKLKPDERSVFARFRGAGGDGGVECIWVLPDGSKWGIQSKFFFALDKSQLDLSVKQALEVHPTLTRYFFFFPFDFTGPTNRKGKSETEKFASYAKEWQSWLPTGKTISFERLGRSEILDLLASMPAHESYTNFWFGPGTLLDPSWFAQRLNDRIKAEGPRYTPELSVDVPLRAVLASFGRMDSWNEKWLEYLKDFSDMATRWSESIQEKPSAMTPPFPVSAVGAGQQLSVHLKAIRTILRNCRTAGLTVHDSRELRLLIDKTQPLLIECENASEAALQEEFGENWHDTPHFRQFHAEFMVSFPAIHLDTTRELRDRVAKLLELCASAEFLGPAHTALIITGNAGTGKTHSIIDHAIERERMGLRSIVLAGREFNERAPLAQIKEMLGVGAQTDECFLSMLNIAGECTSKPLIIFIDAVNETMPDRKKWRDWIPVLASAIGRYEYLKLCVSCRSTYSKDCIRDDVVAIRYEHRGFEGLEADASIAFFAHYGLELPSMPILQPEFANGLFLKLVCQSLQESGARTLPPGMVGWARLVEYLLTTKNKIVADRLDYDELELRLQRAVDLLAAKMAITGLRALPYALAKETIESTYPSNTRSQSLFDQLIREGLLALDAHDQSEATSSPSVRFVFERIGDHLIADHKYQETCENAAGTPSAEALRELIQNLCEEDSTQRGLLEAFAIVLPERLGVEVVALVPEQFRRQARELVVQSLPWRSEQSITGKTIAIVQAALQDGSQCEQTLDVISRNAPRYDHPFNAEYLHQILVANPMSTRDAWWCGYLHGAYERKQGAYLLFSWALPSTITAASPEAARLWGLALAWFCAAADRRVRDRATKTLVLLFEAHPRMIHELIVELVERARLDDDYVIERLLCSAYGALLRSSPPSDIWVLIVERIYNAYFDVDASTDNALIRDHARLIVELANDRGVLPNTVDIARVRRQRPVQRTIDWPTDAEVKAFDSRDRYPRLYASCMEDDFQRYIIEANVRPYGIRPADAGRWILKEVVEGMGCPGYDCHNYDRMMLARYGALRRRPVWAERIGKKYQWIALQRLVGLLFDQIPPDDRTWKGEIIAATQLSGINFREIDPTDFGPIEAISDEASQLRSSRTKYQWQKAPNSLDAWIAMDDFFDLNALLLPWKDMHDSRWTILDWTEESRFNESANDEDYPYRLYSLNLGTYFVKSSQISRLRSNLAKDDGDEPGWMDSRTYRDGYLFEFSSTYVFRCQLDPKFTGSGPLAFHGIKVLPTVADINPEFGYDCSSARPGRVLVPSHEFVEGLVADHESSWKRIDNGRRAITRIEDDSGASIGIAATQTHLEDFMAKRGYTLMALLYQKKMHITGGVGDARIHERYVCGVLQRGKWLELKRWQSIR